MARERDLLGVATPLVRIEPVIVVRLGNPKSIGGVGDLSRADLRLSLANPDVASIGKQTRELLRHLGRWAEVERAVLNRGVFKPTVGEVANDVKLGIVDAGIVWDATVNQYPDLEAVAIEGAELFVQRATVGLLNSSRRPAEALRSSRYLADGSKGAPVFERMGFRPVEQGS